MKEAKVFISGNSQAIRLPKEYRVDVDTVKINRIGNLLVIIQNEDPWANFKKGIQEAKDFPMVNDDELSHKDVKLG
jgi:antitoxin VapB